MINLLVLSHLCSRFSTCIVYALVEVDGIFLMRQKAVAMVTGVVDPLGVGGFNVFDVVILS